MKNIANILIGFLIGVSVPAAACDYCLLTQGISPLETSHGIGLRLDQRYTRLGVLLDSGQKIDNHDALETHRTTQLTAFYSPKPRVTLIGVVPFVRRFEREGEERDHHHDDGGALLAKISSIGGLQHRARLATGPPGGHGTAYGVGDVVLLARIRAVERHDLASTFILSMQAGLRLPTGRTDVTNDEGEVLNAHIQPGTGAWSYLAGFAASYAYKRFNAAANGVVSLAGEGEVGDDRYEYGNAVNYDASLRYRISGALQSQANVYAALGIAGEYRQHEQLNGQALDDTGGNTLYLTPGLQVFFRSLVFEVAFWRPIGRDLNGRQLGESFKTFAGVTYLIQ